MTHITQPITVPQSFEEPIAGVLRVLQLQLDPEIEAHSISPSGHQVDTFIGTSLPQERKRVYGGQVLAQSLLAACAGVDDQRLPHSLHASFIRSGVFEEDIRFRVERWRDGRSFSSRSVDAAQSEGTICSAIVSFQENQPGLRHQGCAPQAPAPEDCTSALEVFREINHPVARFLGKTAAFDVRHCEDDIYFTPPAAPSSSQMLWVRPRKPVPTTDFPQVVHRAMLTYIADQVMLEPALRAHGLSWASPGLSLATLDHTQYFLDDVDINDWHLFVGHSPAAVGSRGIATCEVYDRSGRQVSYLVQEGMIRLPQCPIEVENPDIRSEYRA